MEEMSPVERDLRKAAEERLAQGAALTKITVNIIDHREIAMAARRRGEHPPGGYYAIGLETPAGVVPVHSDKDLKPGEIRLEPVLMSEEEAIR